MWYNIKLIIYRLCTYSCSDGRNETAYVATATTGSTTADSSATTAGTATTTTTENSTARNIFHFNAF